MDECQRDIRVAENFSRKQTFAWPMREYPNGEIVVCWDPAKCIHAQECVKGLPQVFNREKKPWVNMHAASSEEIMRAIDRCPSGALSYRKAEDAGKSAARIKVVKNGPLLVDGQCSLVYQDGKEAASRGPFALCRCAGSKNKPFCDGTHIRNGFDDSK
ncbi:Divergent 4Fe-4S mono-cluster [uncultured archaeon]|nr:Divergent 4Fe-4S mono-cluster [uncultured archaeon]